MASELKTSRRLRRTGLNSYKGTISIICPNSRLDNEAARLWNQSFPGMSGDNAPIATEVLTEEHFREGFGRVTGFYETARQPGKAKIRLATRQDMVDMWRAINDKLGANGANTDEAGNTDAFFWKLEQGAGSKWNVPLVDLIIETATLAEGFSVIPILDAIDHTNDQNLPAPLGAKKNHLLFKHLTSVVPVVTAGAVMVYLNYHMTYKQTPWNEGHIATQYVNGPSKQIKRNANGSPIKKEDGTFVFADSHETKPRMVNNKKVTKAYDRYDEIRFSAFLPSEFEW